MQTEYYEIEWKSEDYSQWISYERGMRFNDRDNAQAEINMHLESIHDWGRNRDWRIVKITREVV